MYNKQYDIHCNVHYIHLYDRILSLILINIFHLIHVCYSTTFELESKANKYQKQMLYSL